MPEDFGPTGIDPDWYDHGPGSVAWNRKLAREMAEHKAKRFRQHARDAAIVKAAEAETEAEEQHLHSGAMAGVRGVAFDSGRADGLLDDAREARRKAVRRKVE